MERKLLRLFLRLIKIFLKNKERVHIALAGGKTPMPFYRMLSLGCLPWERLYFYLTDERFVPLNSPQSNYKNIRENLGAKAKIIYVNTELPLEGRLRRLLPKASPELGCVLAWSGTGRTHRIPLSQLPLPCHNSKGLHLRCPRWHPKNLLELPIPKLLLRGDLCPKGRRKKKGV
jgi:hypothetical protein